jgi:hypothetical protein
MYAGYGDVVLLTLLGGSQYRVDRRVECQNADTDTEYMAISGQSHRWLARLDIRLANPLLRDRRPLGRKIMITLRAPHTLAEIFMRDLTIAAYHFRPPVFIRWP